MTIAQCRHVVLAASAVLFAVGTMSVPGTARPHGGPIVAAARTASVVPIEAADGVEALGTTRPAAHRYSGAPGYTLFTPRVIGDRPSGQNVRVDPRARHRSAVARNAARAVAEQRRQGVRIRWHGYGSPRTASGWINIIESTSGCRRGTRVVGTTWPGFVRLPNGDLYVDHATIALCPSLFSHYGWRVQNGAVRHELGHAVGLAHTNYVYRGHYQVMNAVIHPSSPGYRSGDARGLRRLAANAARVRREVPPVGRFERSAWQPNNTIMLSGWSSLTLFRSDPLTITVTDNGRIVHRTKTNAHSHRFSVYVPWRGGWHKYCVRASSSRSAVAATNLGCTTWHS
jgi:hypothetical protein